MKDRETLIVIDLKDTKIYDERTKNVCKMYESISIRRKKKTQKDAMSTGAGRQKKYDVLGERESLSEGAWER